MASQTNKPSPGETLAVGGIAVPKDKVRVALGWGTRLCAILLSLALTVQPIFSQATATAKPAPGETSPTRLEIQVLSAQPMLEPAGALSANRVAVRIVDGWGMPVPQATVSFRLPEAGPGGVFLNGLSTEVVISDREGRAVVQGFDWRAEPGTSFLHVIAAYGAIRAGAMVELQLTPKAPNAPSAGSDGVARTPSESANPSAFPFPEESLPARRAADPSQEQPSTERQTRIVLGRQATEPPSAPKATDTAAPGARVPAPREMPPRAPSEDSSAVNATKPPAYVTVTRKSGGGKTLLILGVVAAAAGGALVAAMASRGSSSDTAGAGGAPNPAGIVIGSPSITVSGGRR